MDIGDKTGNDQYTHLKHKLLEKGQKNNVAIVFHTPVNKNLNISQKIKGPYFPHSSVGKVSACNARDLGSVPGSGNSPGEGNGNPLQCSCLENPMDRGAWQTTVHRVTKTQLSALSFFIMLRNNNSYLSVIYHFRLNVHSHFPGGPSLKNLPASARDIRDVGSIPGLGKSPGEGNGNPFQYSCLENPMDREDWWATVHGVSKSCT